MLKELRTAQNKISQKPKSSFPSKKMIIPVVLIGVAVLTVMVVTMRKKLKRK